MHPIEASYKIHIVKLLSKYDSCNGDN